MKEMFWLLAWGLVLCALSAVAAGEKESRGTGPWDLKELRKAPRSEVAETREVMEGETQVLLSSLYYPGEPWQGKPTRVFAYFARPKQPGEKKLPAMVLVHGGGGTAFPKWARLWAARGYAALAMDLSGSGPDRKRLPDGGPPQDHEWKFGRLKDGIRNAWSYHTVAAVIRGVSLLRARPEVDRNRVGITGISWGGYLTCIAMSLDDRLKAAVPVYGCGYLHENSAWVSILNELPEAERRTWIETFDPSRYLGRCKIPVLWMNGTNDRAYPLDSYQKSYRTARGPHTLCVTVEMPHSHEAGWERPEIHLFTDSILRPEELEQEPARVSPPQVQGRTVTVAYDGGSAMRQAQLHWTTDTEKPWQERKWKTLNGRVEDLHTAGADLPVERPLVFFLTLTDSRGAVTSSEHVELARSNR